MRSVQARLIAVCATVFLILGAGRAGAVEVTQITSPGGLVAWLVEDHTLPLVSVEFSFRGERPWTPRVWKGWPTWRPA